MRSGIFTWAIKLPHFSELKPPKHINCDGIALPVSQNLYDALWQLTKIDDVTYVWIDAICINQADRAERSQQVARMNKIFTGKRGDRMAGMVFIHRCFESLTYLGT